MMNGRLLSNLIVVVSGALFGFGLALSTMIKPEVVLGFLRFDDFGLLLVLGGAASVTLVVYQLAPRFMDKPLLASAFGRRPTEAVKTTLMGSALFGVGWGLCGVCPGPAIAGLGAGNWSLLVVVFAMALGAYVQGYFASKR